ncbi:MAG TPA: efflux RND transporter periplasmic adaptor subunit [Bacteroidia bacterium]|nr:efflux RND transporter periplasmic adaptor subunit [Bacteroidia bacterium]
MAKDSSVWKKVGIAAIALIIILVVAKKAGWIGSGDEVKVSTDKVELKDITETVSASGKVQPEVEIKITADVSGEIVDLFVKEGDVVKKGTLLCRINPEIYLSTLDRAQAAVSGSEANLSSSKSRLAQSESQLKKAELTYNRNKALFEDKAISPQEFEAVKSAYEVAKAEVDAAKMAIAASSFNVKSSQASLKESKENLNKTNIYAPVDGTVSKLSKEKGERVVGTNMMEGTEILRLANLNEMEVNVDVSESDIVRVSRGDTADIEIDAYLGRKFKGVVTEVANSATVSGTLSTDQVTNFTVKARIIRESYADLLKDKPKDFSPFRPGMSTTVDIITNKVSNVVVVPIQAVTTRDTTKMTNKKTVELEGKTVTKKDTKEAVLHECVFVIKDGKAKLQVVKVGIQDNMNIQILNGLKVGDAVITSPFNAVSKTLKDGDKVKVVSKDELFEKVK